MFVLKRKMTENLLKWMSDPNKKCLLVMGARQVGKTFTINEFAKANYDNYVYVNFELDQKTRMIFDGDLDMDTIIFRMSTMVPGARLVPGKTLIFLDEIQSCPGARTALKTFSMDKRFDVVASGSLLGLNYREVSSYPVGYETKLWMHPLDFGEFLWAYGLDDTVIKRMSEMVRKRRHVDEPTLRQFEEYFLRYVVVGGMPEAVKAFFATKDAGAVRAVQEGIVSGYMDDIKKYVDGPDKQRAQACLDSIPAQLMKRNKRFLYSDVEKRENVGIREYGNSLSWLRDAGIISFCHNVSDPAIPLAVNKKAEVFKAYMNDTGLLMSMMGDGASIALLCKDVSMNSGAIYENAVADVLDKKGLKLYYFEKRGRLEIDFLTVLDAELTAVEVKSGNDVQSKSLDALMSNHGVKRGIKLGRTGIANDGDIECYPLFAAFFLFPDASGYPF
jgi:predicted AAA+ superfamily ATPase